MVYPLPSVHSKGFLLAYFKKRTVLALMLLIVLISLALRYPLVEHERHNDTFFNRMLANSILEDDYAVWTFHPLSYVGYYPLSYPSGAPFLLAEISEMAGVDLSLSILILGMFSGVLFALSVFCLSRVLLTRIDLCVLATALAVFAPRFVDISYWSGSARAPFVALVMLTIFVAFRTGTNGRPAYVVVLGIAAIGCFVLHHMAVMFVIFLIAYLLSVLIMRAALSFAPNGTLTGTKRMFVGFTAATLGIAAFLVAVLYLSYYGPALEDTYASTSLFSFEESTTVSTVLNIAASYTHQIGFVLPIAIFGLPFYLIRSRLTITSLFPVLLIICFIPLLPRAEYITMVIAPFVAVLGVAWLETALKGRRWRRIVMAGLVILICASLVLPVWSTQRWNDIKDRGGDSIASDMQLFTDAEYLRGFGDQAYAISNCDVLSKRLAGVSGVLFLKSGLFSALSGDVTAESIEGNLSMAGQPFPQNLYLWFSYEDEYDVSNYVFRYLTQGCRFPAGEYDIWHDGGDYYETHTRLLVVVDNRWPEVYIWAWGISAATLPSELSNAQWQVESTTYPLQSYSIYISERITLYATEVPNGYG